MGPRRAADPSGASPSTPSRGWTWCSSPTIISIIAIFPPCGAWRGATTRSSCRPSGYTRLIAPRAQAFSRITELDWWQDHAHGPAADVTLVPALHWCRRSPFSTNVRLWGGFMLQVRRPPCVFRRWGLWKLSGSALFPEIRRRCGAPDLASHPDRRSTASPGGS